MKLDLVLENTRIKYSLGLLEEGVSEKEQLQGKVLINEATMTIRKILVENGLIQDTKTILEAAFIEEVRAPNNSALNKLTSMASKPGPIGEPSNVTNAINKTAMNKYVGGLGLRGDRRHGERSDVVQKAKVQNAYTAPGKIGEPSNITNAINHQSANKVMRENSIINNQG